MTSRPWLDQYAPGVRWDAELPRFAVHHAFFETVKNFPDRPAIEFMGSCLTYREYGSLVEHAAAGLQRLGVGPGVHVGLFLPNTPHYLIAFFAVQAAGGVVVNYSPLDAADVLAHKIEDSRTDILFTLNMTSLYPQMAAMLARTRLKRLIVGDPGEFTGNPDQVIADLREQGQLCDIPDDDRHMSFAALLNNDGKFCSHAVDDLDNTVALLQYTGGTTGPPKGAMLTHANLSTANSQCMVTLAGEQPVLEPGQERILVVLPLFHIFALNAALMLGMRLAAHLILHARFDAGAAIRDIATSRVTVFFGVPTMFTAMVSHPDTATADLSSMKYCGAGGAPIPEEVAHRFQALTGCTVIDGWGMTESTAMGTLTPLCRTVRYGSCGIPLPGIDLKFVSVDDPEVTLAYGETGEICIKGRNIMAGYWNHPEETRNAFTADGYLRTGDVGKMDQDGYVRILDRTKDMLLCSGYNVYPRVIEEAIYQHDAVEEACVIGIPDAYRGQSPKAFITMRDGMPPLTLDELQAFLRSRLGRHEMIHALEVRDSLPKTPVGKMSKRELIDEEARQRAATGS